MKHLLFVFLFLLSSSLIAQKPLLTKDGYTKFYSHSPLEDIEAENEKTTAAIDFEKRQVVIKMLIKHFTFENALMQEHFNENYMESERFPSAIFQGKIVHEGAIDLSQNGIYEVSVEGSLTIHGVTQPLTTTAKIEVKNQEVLASTKFIARPADFDIKIPTVVVKNIAEEIEVTSRLSFTLSKK